MAVVQVGGGGGATFPISGTWYTNDAYHTERGFRVEGEEGYDFSIVIPRDPRNGEQMSLAWESYDVPNSRVERTTNTGTWECPGRFFYCSWTAKSGDRYRPFSDRRNFTVQLDITNPDGGPNSSGFEPSFTYDGFRPDSDGTLRQHDTYNAYNLRKR